MRSAVQAVAAVTVVGTGVLGANWFALSAVGLRAVPVVLPVVLVVAVVLVAALPLSWLGHAVLRVLHLAQAPRRLRNVADELALAGGQPPGAVAVVPSWVPNVGVFPTAHGPVVVATEGALALLRRDELEALVAAQAAVGRDRWCRLATRAEVLVQACRLAAVPAAFCSPVLLAVVVPAAFIGTRATDAGRDLVADTAAVAATRHPQALADALRRLRPAVLVADRLESIVLRSLADPCWVVPTRRRAVTTVTVNGRRRSWTTADESAIELSLRAERLEALAGGADPRAFGARTYRARYRALGTTATLTAEEREVAAGLAPASLPSLPPLPPPLPPPGPPGGAAPHA